MNAIPATPPTEQVFGIAKKMSLELEKLPLHTHAAVITLMNTMVQHRKMALDMEMSQQQLAANHAAMDDARKAHAQRQAADEQRIAAEMTKPPRQVIDIGQRDATRPAGETNPVEPKESVSDRPPFSASSEIGTPRIAQVEEVPV